jgi:dihydroneopterin aldolase
LLEYGEGRSWKLIEKVATDVAAVVMNEFRPQGVTVEVKKFAVPQAKYVSVTWTQKRQG